MIKSITIKANNKVNEEKFQKISLCKSKGWLEYTFVFEQHTKAYFVNPEIEIEGLTVSPGRYMVKTDEEYEEYQEIDELFNVLDTLRWAKGEFMTIRYMNSHQLNTFINKHI